jgi:F-type H+-transporting ATPase subunit b
MAGETETTAPAAATAAGTVAEGGEHSAFPPFDASTFPSQLLWFAITFILLYYILGKVAVPRIAGILEDRRSRIAGDLDKAEKLKAQSEAAVAAYEKALAEARAKAYRIAEEAREKAKSEANARQAENEAQLAKQLAAAEARIADIKARALSEVSGIAGDAADAVIRQLTDQSVPQSEIASAVSAVMAK